MILSALRVAWRISAPCSAWTWMSSPVPRLIIASVLASWNRSDCPHATRARIQNSLATWCLRKFGRISENRMKIDAVIFGASGYGGGELLFWLSRHPEVCSLRGTSRNLGGKQFSTAHPNLLSVVDGRFESEIDWQDLTRSEQPVIFSALPHGELAGRLRELESAWSRAGVAGRMVLVDLSADFRVPDPRLFQQPNGFDHPCPELLSQFVYGLPEWNSATIKGAKRIASPGCFATALQLALLTLRGLQIDFLAASAATGSSGSGAS